MAKHTCPNRFAGEGADGGCFFEIEPGAKPQTASLKVGYSCVIVHDKDIPITWLAALVAIARDHVGGIPGFLAQHDGETGYALMCDPADKVT